MNLKAVFAVVLVLVGANLLSAQKGFYNVLLDHIGTDAPFVEPVKYEKYKVDGSEVIEYYSFNSNRFLGLKINKESINASKLHFIKNDKQLREMVKKHGLKEALTFKFDNISPGMSKDEVYSILGKPARFTYGIDHSSQILSCYFIDSIYDSMVFRDDVLEKIIYL